MRYFVTADTHFGHGNIIEYAQRPYKDSQQMNKSLITNWNMRVKPEDTVFVLGDFCFRSGTLCEKATFWLGQLNGQKIMVRGNHDNNNSTKTIIDCLHVTYAGQRINMCHKPEHANPDFDINLVGHVHRSWRIRTFAEHYSRVDSIMNSGTAKAPDREDLKKFLREKWKYADSKSILLNTGVDVQKYMPLLLDEALSQVAKFKKLGDCSVVASTPDCGSGSASSNLVSHPNENPHRP